MPIDGLAIVFGLIIMVWAADRFVLGASSTASLLGISPLIIGIIVVGFGTSAPEMLISTFSAWQGNPGLAIGNALGSNIANIALILGSTALIRPLVIQSDIVRREFPILITVTLLLLVLILDRQLDLLDGMILICSLVFIMGWMTLTALKGRGSEPVVIDPVVKDTDPSPLLSTEMSLFWLITGLILLLISSKVLVWGAVNIATQLGISDLVIGLTIVAIGTSLPELAASVASVMKGQQNIAVGNVIGSNIFNTLGVVGIPAIIQPFMLSDDVLRRDFPVMLGLTLLLLWISSSIRGPGKIKRIDGSLLLLCFFGYQALLYASVL